VRTLQRRLEQEGTTYHDVLESVRRALAELYMNDDSLSFVDIAFLLGYSDLSAFSRAFKRWHGVAPTHRRARQSVA
jgi:AraC-like DNA-binding protein